MGPQRRITIALLATLLVAMPSAGPGALAAERFSLSLPDVRDGTPRTVAPGARALHVVFLATWCPHCVDELEALAELEARWQQSGYRLVIVAVRDRQDAERLRRFVDRQEVPGLFVFDRDGAAAARFGAADLPTHVVLDAEGREVLRAARLSDETVARIGKLLAGR